MGSHANPRRHPQVASAREILASIGVEDVEAEQRRGCKFVVSFEFRGRRLTMTLGAGKENPRALRGRIRNLIRHGCGVEVLA